MRRRRPEAFKPRDKARSHLGHQEETGAHPAEHEQRAEEASKRVESAQQDLAELRKRLPARQRAALA